MFGRIARHGEDLAVNQLEALPGLALEGFHRGKGPSESGAMATTV